MHRARARYQYNYYITFENKSQAEVNMAITAQKIAELAGVSRGTVARALKNRTGVNPETKEKILEIARKYNYKPNLIG